MAEVVYSGPFPEVDVVDPATGRRYVAERGKPVEVPAELAKSLREQETWQNKKVAKAAKED